VYSSRLYTHQCFCELEQQRTAVWLITVYEGRTPLSVTNVHDSGFNLLRLKNNENDFLNAPLLTKESNFSWLQTSAVSWMSYSFFWIILRCLNFLCRHFGTICLFHLHRSLKQPMKMEQTDVPKRLRWKFRRHGITQKKDYNKLIFVRNSQVSSVCPLLKSSFEDEDKYGVPPKNKQSNFLSNVPPISKRAFLCFRLSNFTCLSFCYLPT
jgi:hypothetical protein